MKSRIYLTVCVMLCGGVVFAQPSLTLEQYRRQVVEYSNQLKISGEDVTAAAEHFKMVRTGYLPALSATAEANYQHGNHSNPELKYYNYNSALNLQQAVYAGGAVRAGTKAADIQFSISQANAELSLQNVIYTADLAYWAFAASVEQRAVAATYVDIIRNLYNIVNIRFTDGYISRTDLLMVQTRLNEAELAMISANQLYINSLINLGTLLGHDDIMEYSVGDSISVIEPLNRVISADMDLGAHPEYRAAELNVSLQNQNIKVARSRYNPQLNVGVQGIYGTVAPNLTGNPKLYGVAFVSLNVPIFMWGERRHSVAISRSGVRSGQYALSQTYDRMTADLNSAIVNLDLTMKQVHIAKRNLSVAKENLDLNTFSYGEGRLPILDVLQSQLYWIQAYTSFVNSNYSYHTAVSSYYKSVGILQ